MTVSAIDQADFRLPARIRAKPGPDAAGCARVMLAERSADPPLVQTVEDGSEALCRAYVVDLPDFSRTSLC